MNKNIEEIQSIFDKYFDDRKHEIIEIIFDWYEMMYPFIAAKVKKEKALFGIIKEEEVYILLNILDETNINFWRTFWSWRYIYQTNELSKINKVINKYIDNHNKIIQIKELISTELKNVNMKINSLSVSNFSYINDDNASDNAYLTDSLKFEFTVFYKESGRFVDFTYWWFMKTYWLSD